MEDFIVSARKYRPTTFDSVVGQEALVATLKNAIVSNRLSHAYLFCGPRGVGKTTCARIFAKAINCENRTADGEACDECVSCKSFSDGRSMNIHELDAASNNGTEDIHQLMDAVRVPPQMGKYSVFIIDEVHMLSTAAFNAFLKTLEEPPAYAIFILATTEKQKIPATILSRCQIYDFSRISIADITKQLSKVAEREGVTIDEESLNVIARKADGGMRDALSTFDQVVSYCGKTVKYQDVIANLGVLDYEYYFRLVGNMLNGETADALSLFNEVLEKGFDGGRFVEGLCEHFRDLMVSVDPKTTALLEVGGETAARYAQQAQECGAELLYDSLDLANQCSLAYRGAANKRLLVELLLVRLTRLKKKD